GPGFVADGEAERAVLPAEGGVLPQDGAVDLVSAGGGRPHDVPALEGVVAAVLVRSRLITGGEAQEAQLPAQVGVLAPDGAVHLVGAGARGPVDVAVLEVVVAAVVPGGERRITHGLAQGAALPPHPPAPCPYHA